MHYFNKLDGVICTACSTPEREVSPMFRMEYVLSGDEVLPFQMVCTICGVTTRSMKGKFHKLENNLLCRMAEINAPWGAKADVARRVLRSALALSNQMTPTPLPSETLSTRA